MCGPSAGEKNIESQQDRFASTLQENYNQQFASQNDVLNGLNNALNPIVAAGPGQQGFSPQELAAQNTEAINSTGAAYKDAAQAVGGQLAGRGGGGSSGLESGIDQQIKGTLASKAAGNLSSQQLGITQNNYATGLQNFNNAVGGERALADLYNPTAYAQNADSANSTAFGEENQINTQENQEQADLFGSIAGVGLDALTFGAGAAGGGGLTGGVKALSGGGFN